MSQVRCRDWIMSDRLDRDRPASIQLTATMKTKLIDFIPFLRNTYVWWKAYKSTKIHNDKGATDRPSSMIYHVVVSIVLIEIVIEMVKQLTT
jgi:hypothetical protein